MFDAMISDIRDRTVRMILSVTVKTPEIKREQLAKPLSEGFEGDGTKKPRRVSITKKAAEAGRNDLCPCGSGKKYKKCCGAPGANNN
jgi:preprotein translocase subunit SecA